VTLLIDTLPFLSVDDELAEIYFSSEQTFELMHCLEVSAEQTSKSKDAFFYSLNFKVKRFAFSLFKEKMKDLNCENAY
jgi:hypothetical protein